MTIGASSARLAATATPAPNPTTSALAARTHVAAPSRPTSWAPTGSVADLRGLSR